MTGSIGEISDDCLFQDVLLTPMRRTVGEIADVENIASNQFEFALKSKTTKIREQK